MFSGFLKKLLFAREFSIIDGKINILGSRFVMLPDNMLLSIIKELDEKQVEEFSFNYMRQITPRLATDKTGMLQMVGDIFDIYGFGKFQIEDINIKKNNISVIISDIAQSADKENAEKNTKIIEFIIAGYFRAIFGKKMVCKTKKAGEAAIKFVFV
ncbi:MAG: hypothetical protein KKF44_07430 [Nanoarchaeota archaeon]|nr:hypothetical protein [Nanoarchaeota archaeon]